MASIVQRRRELRLEARERQQSVVPKLRAAVRQARKDRTKRLSRIRSRCKRRASRVSTDAQRAREQLRERIAATRAKARELCALAKVRASDEELRKLERAIEALQREREAIADLRRRASRLKSSRGRAGGVRSAELRAESDDEVRRDIGDDPTLLAVWERVKGKIRPGARRSRTEAFWEYLHDHPEAVNEEIARSEERWAKEAEELLGGRIARAPRGDLEELEAYGAELDNGERLIMEHETRRPAEVPF